MSYWRRLRPEEGGRFADAVGPDAETVARIRATDDCVVKKAPAAASLVGKRLLILVDRPLCAALHKGDIVEVTGQRGTDTIEVTPHWVLDVRHEGVLFEVLP